MKAFYAAILLFVLAASACVDFASESLVETFRVLAVQAEPPEIAPGQGTTLRIFWADPKGEGREVSFAWVGCSGRVHANEGFTTCDMMIPPVVRTASEGGDTLEIPASPSDVLDGLPEDAAVEVTFIAVMCAGGALPPAEEIASRRDLVRIKTLCNGGDALSAFKTVTISNASTPETNPVIDHLEIDGVPIETKANGGAPELVCDPADDCNIEVKLSLFVTEESVEWYEVSEFGKPVTQEDTMFVTWFANGGEFSATRSGTEAGSTGPFETTWRIDKSGTYTLYVAVHDMRGGATLQIYTVATKTP